MATDTRPRADVTRARLLDAALREFSAFGYRRASMESLAQGAKVSRATVYLHFATKQELFRALVKKLHAEHLTAMQAVLSNSHADFETRVVAILEARFLRFVQLTSASPHAAELYDLHGRLCGDVARASQEHSERLLARMLRRASAAGEVDLAAVGLSAARVASVLFDCAHGAKGEDPSTATPAEFRDRLARTVRVLVVGLSAKP